jgi:hypothetical protein
VNLWRDILAFPELDGDRVKLEPAEARAQGVELYVQKDGETWDWSASYSLSSSEDLVEGEWIPRMMDQPHALSLTAAYRPNLRWRLSAAWQYRSGWPFTPQMIHYDTLSVFQDQGYIWPLRWKEEFGSVNSTRLPDYHRLDLRITREFAIRRSRLELYLDVFNAYDQPNLRSYSYGTRRIHGYDRWVQESGDEMMPIIPSLGFRWSF